MKVAVIGAGIAGISCASALHAAGCSVMLFDKARGPGGRMTSKRTGHGYMDFGAQYFTARHPKFQQQVARWQQQGVVSRWLAPMYQYNQGQLSASPDEQQRFIGIPAMHSPLKWQAQSIPSEMDCRITSLQQVPLGWQLTSENGQVFGPFQHLVLSLPPVQAAALLNSHSASLATATNTNLPETLLQPCWAVTLVLAAPTGHAAGGIFVKGEHRSLSWISRQNSKPGRAQVESWLLHFSPHFSASHLQASTELLQQHATDCLSEIIGKPISVTEAICHRWLYAQIDAATAQLNLSDNPQKGVWLAGDWMRGGRVENAWLSGDDIASKILALK